MTDWHCTRCRRYARLYRDTNHVKCGWCARKMTRGRGRRTTFDRHHDARTRALEAGETVRAGYEPRRGSAKQRSRQ